MQVLHACTTDRTGQTRDGTDTDQTDRRCNQGVGQGPLVTQWHKQEDQGEGRAGEGEEDETNGTETGVPGRSTDQGKVKAAEGLSLKCIRPVSECSGGCLLFWCPRRGVYYE